MATSRTSEVIQHLRRATLLQDGAGLTDGQLLAFFIERQDEADFAALVRRHGPMVWGVCRRVLGNHHDAEDAFQATFLVLVRKAASIASRELLANWLYGVARQTALKARATVAKRKVRERQGTEMPEPAVAEQDHWRDLQPLLDQELSRLPDNYRAVIVLCDLEGKTRKETARQLGLPEGTVGSRLARARAMLANRLARHGLAVSGGALAAVLSQHVASAGVPISVVSSTIKAASLLAVGQAAAAGAISIKVTALTEGVLKTMLLNKLKVATVVLVLAALVCCGIGVLTITASAQGQAEPAKKAEAKEGKPMEDTKTKPIRFIAVIEKVDGDAKSITARSKVFQYAGKAIPGLVPDDKFNRTTRILGHPTVDGTGRDIILSPTRMENLSVSANAKIKDGGKEIQLTDLKAGTHAHLDLTVSEGGIVVVGIEKVGTD